MTRFALLSRYPFLESKITRINLGAWPTALEPLPGLINGPFLIKRDDLSHPLYGGNKVRKLEFIFADALQRGCKEMITAGGLGSHHVLAVSALGRSVGLNTTGLLFCQPVNRHVRQNLLLEKSFGTEMHFVRDYRGVGISFVKLYLRRRFNHRRRPYLLMPGGSNALSTLGYLNAALELEAQLRQQGLPDPEAIFTAAGTGGTAAGLLAGLALTRMDTILHAVRVVHPSVLDPDRVTTLALQALRLLRCLGVETAGAEGRLKQLLHFEEGYLGEGYGFNTLESDLALQLFQEQCGITLEGCYTGKAAAAALAYGRRRNTCAERPVIFVHTASSTHLQGNSLQAEADLPSQFHWCFDRSKCSRRCGLRQRNLAFCENACHENWCWEETE